MGKIEDLENIDRSIKDAEVRLKTFSNNVDVIKKEINFLLSLEKQLEENISYLKDIKIVALATEYKKAKEDLKKSRIRLSQLKGDLISNEKALKDVEKVLQKNKELYDKLSKQNENNVVQGKFGKIRG